jgi:hypothetical protein
MVCRGPQGLAMNIVALWKARVPPLPPHRGGHTADPLVGEPYGAEEGEARSLDRDHSHVLVPLEAPKQCGVQCGKARRTDSHPDDPIQI